MALTKTCWKPATSGLAQAPLVEALEDTLYGLLQQMSEGSETNPETRLAALHRQRDASHAEIAREQAGDLALLDDTALKDRFQQFTGLARELLAQVLDLPAVADLQPDRRLKRVHYDWLEAGEHAQRTPSPDALTRCACPAVRPARV